MVAEPRDIWLLTMVAGEGKSVTCSTGSSNRNHPKLIDRLFALEIIGVMRLVFGDP